MAPEGLFDVVEVPDGVGWMYPTKAGFLQIGKEATHNPHPKSDDRFVAMCCRRAMRASGNGVRISKEWSTRV